jgi:C2 domain
MLCWLLFKVHLELLYCPYNMKDEISNPFDKQFSMTSLERTIKNTQNGTPNGSSLSNKTLSRRKEVITRGVLSVTVVSAEDLPAMDVTGKSDPYVVLNMKKSKTKHKTRVSFQPNGLHLLSFMFCFFYLKTKMFF